jgi:hypothetical protein
MSEIARIAAFLFLAVAVWVPLLRWARMSQLQRYLAMVALGAAVVFYLGHPTSTPCDHDVAACGSGY